MNGPVGGRRRRQTSRSAADTPAAVTAPVERVWQALCVCGHPMRFHGDRAVAPCDGGWAENWGSRSGPAGPLCRCVGWERDEMRRSA